MVVAVVWGGNCFANFIASNLAISGIISSFAFGWTTVTAADFRAIAGAIVSSTYGVIVSSTYTIG